VLPEMSAKVAFLAPGASDALSSKPVLTVPAAAVAGSNGRAVVYKIEDGRAVEVPVLTGARFGAQIEIKEGLKEGDKVVAKADERIKPGVKLSVPT
jgi:hypothetical protein